MQVRRLLTAYLKVRRRVDVDLSILNNYKRAYRSVANSYKVLIQKTKLDNWKTFVTDRSDDPWGQVYKICRGKMNRPLLYNLTDGNTHTMTSNESVKAALHSRENERNMRKTRMWMRFSYSSQVLLLFSNCSPYFVGFFARDKETRERENMREHVLTPHSHVSHYFFRYFFFFNIHIVIICESNTQQTCRRCHFSVHCHRVREL